MATGTIAPTPKFTGLDANGNPVAGGLLYTFTAGTSTPINTYTDVGLTVANANPIVLDSSGRATIYLTPGSSYKFNLQTSVGATVWTQDNIAATPVSAASVDVVGTAGEAITAGNAVYLSDGSGSKVAGQWYKADASNAYSSTLPTIGMAPSAITSGAAGTVRLFGSVSGLSSLSVSGKYYVGTSGAITSSPATGGRFLGIADSATSINLTPQPAVPQPWAVITTTSTGTQNDFAPGLIGNTVVRCNNATLLTINGLSGGYDGQRIVLVSVGAGQVDLAHQAAGSSAANRFINFATSGTTSLAAGSGTAEFVYDATTARWRLLEHEQGAWIAFTPTLSGTTQTYGVQSGAYMLRGRTVSVSIYILLTAKGNASGVVNNLPFTAAGAPTFTAAVIGQINNLTTTWVSLSGYVQNSGTSLTVVGRTAASTTIASLVNADLSNTTDFIVSVTYPV
jgi:hypothetical protein